MPDLTIQVQELKGLPASALVVLNGSIDAKTVITFQTHLNAVRDRGVEKFILDMEFVKYVNSTGLGYLINLSDSVSERGTIALVKVQPKVKVVFDMLGLNAFFKIYATREEAIHGLASGEAPASPGSSTAVLKGRESAPAQPPAAHAAPAAAPPPADQSHLECQNCKVLLSIKEPGTYKCPRCLSFFSYQGGAKVTFLPRQKALPVQFSLNFSPECVEGLLEFVKRAGARIGFTPEGIAEMQSAVRGTVEAIQRHAYGGKDNQVYHVLMLSADSELELRFADYGAPLSSDKGDPFAAVRKAVDRFDLKHHPRGGNLVTVAKKAR